MVLRIKSALLRDLTNDKKFDCQNSAYFSYATDKESNLVQWKTL